MIRPYAIMIGLRYAGARKRTQLVSFISALSIAGLTLGVGLLLTVLSVMNGFESELRERILGIMPHGAIYHRYGIEDWESVGQDLLKDDNFVAVAPFVELQAMLSYRKKVVPAGLFGVDVAHEKKVSVVANYIEGKALVDLQADGGIILGRGIAEKLGVTIGKRITVLVPSADGNSAVPKIKAFKVRGFIDSGTELDHSLALTSLSEAGALSKFPGRVSGVRIKVNDLFAAPNLIYQKVRDLPYGFYGSDWTRTHGNLYHAIKVSKNMVGLLLFLIVAIAAFNVVSTLVMVVVDKTSDIAILKTLGATRAEILSVFVVQGSLIGAIGTALGLLLGLLGSLSAQGLVSLVENYFDVQFLKSDVYPISYLPTELIVSDFVLVALISLLLSFVATLYPAWRASKIAPADALRFE